MDLRIFREDRFHRDRVVEAKAGFFLGLLAARLAPRMCANFRRGFFLDRGFLDEALAGLR